MKKNLLILTVAFLMAAPTLMAKSIKVASLSQFATLIAQDNQEIKLVAGTYSLRDYLNADSISSRVARKDYQYLKFSGSGNTIDMKGVILEVDTELRELLKHPIHTDEIMVTGNNNHLKGLEIKHKGFTTSPGGCAFTVKGAGNTIEGFTLRVQGSAPYGYGDLFGKGKDHVIKHQKHSGFLITGDKTTVIGCNLYIRSFGHGYFIQQNPEDVTLIDCYVEGEIRTTEDMLTETDGPAFDVNFRTLSPNRDGEYVVTTGYVKALCEEGFRTYGACKNLRFINCTAKNTRGGFELRSWDESMYLENCTAIGTERAYWLGEGAIAKNCKGDACYGPLLYVEGGNCDVDIKLIASESKYIVNALATIHGKNNKIKISPYKGKDQAINLPIMLGYVQPEHGEAMSPFTESACENLTLENSTQMSVIVGKQCTEPSCNISTKGQIWRD
ncbi:MAG: hypothetical protein SNI70_09070 [Rikenellaceae bacterium]